MWVLIDNYDSFTHILHHYLLNTGNACTVIRNDELSLAELIALNPTRLIISPGPQTPYESGISLAAIAHFHQQIPILGICLGHQALGVFFEAQLSHAPQPMHGKTSRVAHFGHPLFEGIPSPFEAMRYHSLRIQLADDDASLVSLAIAEDDQVLMALAHRSLPLIGIQFHPESIGTAYGQVMINNWAKMNW
jgi:anthranilate synthase/aminodeoxychorismate synthase-like glutamine amidotransferase